MPRYGKSWGIDKLIPAKGEAEVMARVKGSYGARGASAMYRRKRRWSKNSTRNPEAQFCNGTYGNVNYGDGRPNMLWSWDAGGAQLPRRLLSFNADTVASAEEQAQCFLRRINVQMGLMATVQTVNIGTMVEYNANEREQIPAGFAVNSGDNLGWLMGGNPEKATLKGAVSWVEGVPVILFLCYETLAQAESPFETSFSDDSMLNTNSQRNKRIFWQQLVIPTAYNAKVVNVKHSFPGAGVRLSKGDREIYQVTLGYQGPAHAGLGITQTVTEYTAENRFWYFLDKP